MQTDLFDNVDKKEDWSHADFIEIIVVDKAEIKQLYYSFQVTDFGDILVAGTKKQIHWVAYTDSWREGLLRLNENFPRVKITEESRVEHRNLVSIFNGKKSKKKLKFYPAGTSFQGSVWNELLKIPFGKKTSYGVLAERLRLPKSAARAVGTAIGKNPIAYIIPCHRVIQASGGLGGYRWGIERKKEILTREQR